MRASQLAEITLGSAIVAGRDIDAQLAPEFFESPKLGLLWRAYERLRRDAKKVGPLTLRNACNEILGDVKGPDVSLSDLNGWSSPNITDSDIREASETVIRSYRNRQLKQLCTEAAKSASEEGADPDSILNSLVKLAEMDYGNDDELLTSYDLMEELSADWKRRAEAKKEGRPLCIPSGLSELDVALGGGYDFGGVYVLGARPKMGKTAFSMTSAVASAEAKFPVLVISLEMSPVQLARRLLALKSKSVTVGDLKLPKFESQVQSVMRDYNDKIRNLPISYRTRASTARQVVSTARRWWRRHRRHGLIIIDYLQLMSGNDTRNREREVAEMSRSIKLLALELECAVLLLSQLNREVEKRAPPTPRLSDLRESGAIEQDADAIILLYRPSVYKDASGVPYSKNERHVDVILAAAREADPETIPAVFDGAHTRFEDAPKVKEY